jgi:YgiT-type zinc finger domain-containing protein
MACHTPGCMGEHGIGNMGTMGTITHTVLYRERTIELQGVPASLCPDCGDVVLSDETLIVIEDLLKRKARSKQSAFAYES